MSLTCNAPWTGLFVWNDGTISYCGRTAAKGSLLRQTFREFWNSREVQHARSLFVDERYGESGCPPTCCWLTANRPREFMRNFDAPAHEPRVGDLGRASPSPFAAPTTVADNVRLIEREIEGRYSSVASFPRTLSLQLSNYCSLRCPMCCFGVIPPSEKKPTMRLLDPAVLDRVKEVYPFISRVDLIGGELFDIPFEHNPLVRVLADVAETAPETMRITITTNGQHLTPHWADHLVRYPFIDIVAFSIDSFDPETYARTRVAGSLDRVRRSIRNLQEAKARRGGAGPAIHFNSILGVHTHAGVADFLANAQALGADEVNFQKLVVMGDPAFFAQNNLFQRAHVDKLASVWAQLAGCDFRSNRAAIIGQIEAYLDHLGVRHKIVAEGSRVPFVAAYAEGSGTYTDPIHGMHEVVQSFEASRDSVSAIKLLFATYARQNTCAVHVALEDDVGEVILKETLDASSLQDNGWMTVSPFRTKLKLGSQYRLVIRSPDASETNCVTLGRLPGTGAPSTLGTPPPVVGCMLF